MNSPPQSSDDALANESIDIVDDKRRNLDNPAALSSRRLSQRSAEPSLYPTADLPRIDNADHVWASSSRRQLNNDGKKKASTEADKWSAAFSDEAETKEPAPSEQDIREQDSNHTTDDVEHSDDESLSSFERKMVEVTPGHCVPLRGADETLDALDKGQVTNTKCVFCDEALVVHVFASMIICPECEMIAPLEGDNDGDAGISLGLGLRLETLKISLDGDEEELSQQDTDECKPKPGHLKQDPDEDSVSS